jgi:hypothetical protein
MTDPVRTLVDTYRAHVSEYSHTNLSANTLIELPTVKSVSGITENSSRPIKGTGRTGRAGANQGCYNIEGRVGVAYKIEDTTNNRLEIRLRLQNRHLSTFSHSTNIQI